MLPSLQSSVREDEIAKLASSHMPAMTEVGNVRRYRLEFILNEINPHNCVGMEGKCIQERGPLKEGGSRGQSLI
jgi:hypothetical protein